MREKNMILDFDYVQDHAWLIMKRACNSHKKKNWNHKTVSRFLQSGAWIKASFFDFDSHLLTMLALSRRIAPLDTFRRMSQCLATATPEKPDHKHGNLPGSSQSAITSHPHFFNSIMGDDNLIPTYRVIDTDGKPIDGAQLPDFDEGFCRKLYAVVLIPNFYNTHSNLNKAMKPCQHFR